MSADLVLQTQTKYLTCDAHVETEYMLTLVYESKFFKNQTLSNDTQFILQY